MTKLYITDAMRDATKGWPEFNLQQMAEADTLSDRAREELKRRAQAIGLGDVCIVNPVIQKVVLPDATVVTFDELEAAVRRPSVAPGLN